MKSSTSLGRFELQQSSHGLSSVGLLADHDLRGVQFSFISSQVQADGSCSSILKALLGDQLIQDMLDVQVLQSLLED